MYRRVDSIFRQREMNAFAVLLMSLLLMSLLVVSAAASGGQHCASEYRLASITIERAIGIPGCVRRYMLIAIADRFSYKSADRMSLINY